MSFVCCLRALSVPAVLVCRLSAVVCLFVVCLLSVEQCSSAAAQQCSSAAAQQCSGAAPEQRRRNVERRVDATQRSDEASNDESTRQNDGRSGAATSLKRRTTGRRGRTMGAAAQRRPQSVERRVDAAERRAQRRSDVPKASNGESTRQNDGRSNAATSRNVERRFYDFTQHNDGHGLGHRLEDREGPENVGTEP